MPDAPVPPPDPLAGLIRALRDCGLDPDGAGLADALWLARFSRPVGEPGDDGGTGSRPAAVGRPGREHQGGVRHATGRQGAREAGEREAEDADGGRAAREAPGGAPVPGTRTPAEEGPPGSTVRLYADPAGSGPRLPPGPLSPVGVPEPGVLPGLLELERALRPLQRYRSGARPLPGELDETATVERSARAGGVLLPVFRPRPRSGAELRLLIDATPATRVWQRLLSELAGVFTRLGAFRDVQVHHLHESPDGRPAVSSSFEPGAAALRPVNQLVDPTGATVTVMVSDCAGPLWRSGQIHRLLHRLAGHAPVAVVQPLPPRLWARTRLPASHGTLARGDGPAGGVRLRFTPESPAVRPPPGAVPVPLLPPTAAALNAWARLLSGSGGGPVRAAVGWVSAARPPAPRARGRAPLTPAARVGRFRSTASPGAVRLMVQLSAAPLYLPVMQLVQRTMLPDSGPAELSEVLLSGLLRRREEEDGGDGRWYRFADGVHDELLRSLGHDEALLVLKHCSAYVEANFGRAGPNFPALALAQLTGGPAPPGEGTPPPAADAADRGVRVPQPFADVAAEVLRRYLPESASRHTDPAPEAAPPSAAVRQSRALTARFEGDGRVGHLLDAVRLLRRAAVRQREDRTGTDPGLWSELAGQLLRLWRVQGETALLAEAQEAARTAASHPGSVPARTVLARVLDAAAQERRAAGDPERALELWRRSDREFAAVCATPGLPRREAVDLVLERVRVLEEQWRLGADTALLQESVGMLEAMADAWPDGEARPAGLALARGRALLHLAGAAGDGERALVNAEQAAVWLAEGCRALREVPAPPGEQAAALLQLVDALLLTAYGWTAAGEHVSLALSLAGPDQRAGCLVRSGRLEIRWYRADRDPARLERAAGQFALAGRSVARDRPEYSDLLAEWGAAVLERAALPDGAGFVSRAVRVLRDCRTETPAEDPRTPDRLLLLGRALTVRYRHAADLVDLREAEHLFALAAQSAGTALVRARAFHALGDTFRRAHRHTRRAFRLDRAAEAYRNAAVAAQEAAGAPASARQAREAVRLAASACRRRGEMYEAAARPRAAADAYRAALGWWRRLPDGPGEEAERTADRLRALEDEG
ncbi:SAV_2336 N-terminal domain-related protein [Streptomyces sodiiphilus]|uniref:SAV_2336 N-terminal domain-related protein n=1 Tax=Streptomyces sodiiphilus TaxID=226217 RepID=A0ABN2NTA6_9ACTN